MGYSITQHLLAGLKCRDDVIGAFDPKREKYEIFGFSLFDEGADLLI